MAEIYSRDCDARERRDVIMERSDAENRDEMLRALAADAIDDNAAMAALLTAAAPLLRRYCTAQLARYGRGEWAEDMVQEIMLTIHLKLHTYDAGMSFLAWMHAVAKHRIIDGLRRDRMVQVPIEDTEILDGGDSDAAMAKRDLAKLLAGLKPPAGEIIHALKIDGVSIKDLAEKFATSESNIKIIVHRGLRRLARMFGERA